MRLGKLLVYFENSPAIHLLRARHAPFVIDFLDRQFKQSDRIAIPHTDLLAALVVYLEEVQESHPNTLAGKAEVYINEWSTSDEALWLQRHVDMSCGERVYQLTPDTEEVFAFLDRVLDKDLGFIGTESRLKLVIDTLSDLVVGSSSDPQVRLAHLREERDRLQVEIERIEAGGTASKYLPGQIRERFTTAVSLLRELQTDFRAVEDSFRDIASQVQQRHITGQHSRGHILGYALDAEDLLEKEDQGISFREFVKLVLTPSQTERLQTIIQEVRQIPELEQQHEGLDTVRHMISSLEREAEKVMRTKRRLSATLRQLLDVRAQAERQQVARLLQEIRSLAMTYSGEPDSSEIGVSLDLALETDSPFRRTFWVEPPRFESVALSEFAPDDAERKAAFQELAAIKRLHWKAMRDRIRQMLAIENAPTLGQLLKIHPADGGIVEVIAYVQIASEDGHIIEPRRTETISVEPVAGQGNPLIVRVPRVTFVPPRSPRHAK